MLDVKCYLEQLKQIEKPSFLAESEILLKEPKQLRLHLSGDSPFATSRVVFKNNKLTKKQNAKNVWDVDIKATTTPGYFDAKGNFVVNKPKRIVVSWILKKDEICEGPYSESELKNILESKLNNGYLVKRDSDKGFVSLDKLNEEIPNFLVSKDLNRYISQNQQMDEQKKEESFFDEPVFAEKGSKLTNFIRNNEISTSVDFIIKTIKGMRKADAIEVISGITGLNKNMNTSLIDLIVESAGYQILSDVDKDGFYLGNGQRNKKKF